MKTDEIALMNPQHSGRDAYWEFGCKGYTLKPGEAASYPPDIARHGMKYNNFLTELANEGADEQFGEAKVRLADQMLNEARAQLQKQVGVVQQLERDLVQAQANLKALRDQKAANERAAQEQARLYAEQEAEKAEKANKKKS